MSGIAMPAAPRATRRIERAGAAVSHTGATPPHGSDAEQAQTQQRERARLGNSHRTHGGAAAMCRNGCGHLSRVPQCKAGDVGKIHAELRTVETRHERRQVVPE